MLNQFVSPRAVEVITRLASLVSIAFIVALLLVMFAVLGLALGGSPFAYLVALALVGALTVLVLYVFATRCQPTKSILLHDDLPPTMIRNHQATVRWDDASAHQQQGYQGMYEQRYR